MRHATVVAAWMGRFPSHADPRETVSVSTRGPTAGRQDRESDSCATVTASREHVLAVGYIVLCAFQGKPVPASWSSDPGRVGSIIGNNAAVSTAGITGAKICVPPARRRAMTHRTSRRAQPRSASTWNRAGGRSAHADSYRYKGKGRFAIYTASAQIARPYRRNHAVKQRATSPTPSALTSAARRRMPPK